MQTNKADKIIDNVRKRKQQTNKHNNLYPNISIIISIQTLAN